MESDDRMKAGQKVTWDCVWFGSYPQAEVIPEDVEYTALSKDVMQMGDLIKDSELYNALRNQPGEKWNECGDTEINGEKYRRITSADVGGWSNDYNWGNYGSSSEFHYFKYQPIKWRVLSVDGSEAFLLADKALDARKYYECDPLIPSYDIDDVTWESSTMRSWLNGYGSDKNIGNINYSEKNFSFKDVAFDKDEQDVIKDSNIENKNSLEYNTYGGENTIDKIFLLSESEVCTDEAKKYGFISGYEYVKGDGDSRFLDLKKKFDRACKSTSFAKAMGASCDNVYSRILFQGNCYWRLRSPGSSTQETSCVLYDGTIMGLFYANEAYAIRPALNLKLNESSSNFYSYAGTVSSDDTVIEIVDGSDAPLSDDEKTRLEGIYYKSKELIKSYNDYGNYIKSNVKFKYEKIIFASKQLRKYDESAEDRNANRLIEFEESVPEEVIDDTYEALYMFLENFIVLAKSLNIYPADGVWKIEDSDISRIYNRMTMFDGNSTQNGYRYDVGQNDCSVQLRTDKMPLGEVTVRGNRNIGYEKNYSGVFCNDGKVVTQALNKFSEDLERDMENRDIAFLCNCCFPYIETINDFGVRDRGFGSLDRYKDYLMKNGHGEVISDIRKMQDGYYLIKNISPIEDIEQFLKMAKSLDFEEIYKEIKKISYIDEKITDESLIESIKKIELCRKNLEDALYDYLSVNSSEASSSPTVTASAKPTSSSKVSPSPTAKPSTQPESSSEPSPS